MRACVSWCCSRQMKAPRSWLSSRSIIQTSASILSLSPHAHAHTPRVEVRMTPLPSVSSRLQDKDINTHTQSSNLSHASRRALQSQRNWSRRDKDGHGGCKDTSGRASVSCGCKVTQPVPVYSYSSHSCHQHSLTLALYYVPRRESH